MECQDVLGLILVYSIIASSLTLSWLCDRKGYSVDSRKIIHAGVGMFVWVWWLFTDNWIMLAFFTVPFAVILLLVMFNGNPISDSYLGDVSNKMGHRTGLFLYVISINVMVIFFFDGHWMAATIGIAAMTFGDSAGSIVGKRFGKHAIRNNKSVEGSLAVFVTTAIASAILLIFYTFLSSQGLFCGPTTPSLPIPITCIIAGIVASLTEMLCPGQIDNLLNPLLVAITMVALGL